MSKKEGEVHRDDGCGTCQRAAAAFSYKGAWRLCRDAVPNGSGGSGGDTGIGVSLSVSSNSHFLSLEKTTRAWMLHSVSIERRLTAGVYVHVRSQSCPNMHQARHSGVYA